MPNLEAKKALVAEIAEKLKASQGTIVVDYRGLTVEEVTELRKPKPVNRESNTRFTNSSLRLAAKEAGQEGLLESLRGLSAIAFCESDPIAPAKLLADFAKDHENLGIKSEASSTASKSASMKSRHSQNSRSREELVAMTLRGLNAPITEAWSTSSTAPSRDWSSHCLRLPTRKKKKLPKRFLRNTKNFNFNKLGEIK